MPASWWSRVGATLLDGLILVVPFAILIGIAAAIDVPALIVLAYIVYFIVALFYAPVLMARQGDKNGQTYGKQAANIRVVADDGQPVGFGTGAMREMVGKTLLGTVTGGLYSIVDSLWPLWDGRKQAVHDKIGKTTVQRAG